MEHGDLLIAAIVERFRERLVETGARMRTAECARDFFEGEVGLHVMARELADEYTARVLDEMAEDEDRARAAATRVREAAAARNLVMRSQGRRSTPVRLLGGTVVHVRTPYMCARPRGELPLEMRGKTGTGVFPVLDELGITDKATPALRLRVSHAVCEANSVADARELLKQAGLDVSHRVALRLTYATTELALAVRKQLVKHTREGNDDGEFVGRHVVACVDGGRVRIRTALRGRPPKGGRRKFRRDWREPRIITLYVLGENGKRDKKVASVIDGTLGEADNVFELLLYHLRRVGAHRAASLTLVADGAKWIWKRAAGLCQDLGLDEGVEFTEIVDYFHAVERLYEFARSRRRWSEKRVLRWVLQQKKRLKRGWVERIIKSIDGLLTMTERKKGSLLGYWVRNKERLRFQDFRDRGLPNGSGAVESAVRRVINLRLKGPSILWREDHAEGVIHLRAHSKAGRWSEIESVILDNSSWTPKARRRRAA